MNYYVACRGQLIECENYAEADEERRSLRKTYGARAGRVMIVQSENADVAGDKVREILAVQ